VGSKSDSRKQALPIADLMRWVNMVFEIKTVSTLYPRGSNLRVGKGYA
jgi:hypothetical protein